MQQELLATVLFLSYFTLAIASPEVLTLSSNGTIQPQITLVATVDGKSFFAEDVKRTRNDASAYCSSMGLKLASITSPSQYEALKNAYSDDFKGEYWTAGINARALREFSWEGTDDQPESFLPLGPGAPAMNGLTYRQFQNEGGILYPNGFENTWGVLCET